MLRLSSKSDEIPLLIISETLLATIALPLSKYTALIKSSGFLIGNGPSFTGSQLVLRAVMLRLAVRCAIESWAHFIYRSGPPSCFTKLDMIIFVFRVSPT